MKIEGPYVSGENTGGSRDPGTNNLLEFEQASELPGNSEKRELTGEVADHARIHREGVVETFPVS